MKKKIDPAVPQHFGNLELLARQVVEGFITGMHKSPFHGFSVEFAEHRIYNPGESTRNIDWKIYARTEKLFVKRFEEETNLRCQLILDNSSSMYFPGFAQAKEQQTKIGFSVECAAALALLLRKQRDAVGLSILSDQLELHTQARSSFLHHKMLFTEMEKIYQRESHVLNKKTDTAALLHQLAENIHKRSLVIIFSDLMDNTAKPEEIFSALQHLKHNKHDVILFHVFEKHLEAELDYHDRPYRFIDMETSKELKLNPADIRKQYIKRQKEFQEQLRLKCLQFQIDFVPADINLGHNQVLLSFLIKRARLY